MQIHPPEKAGWQVPNLLITMNTTSTIRSPKRFSAQDLHLRQMGLLQSLKALLEGNQVSLLNIAVSAVSAHLRTLSHPQPRARDAGTFQGSGERRA